MPDRAPRPELVLESPLGTGRTSRVWSARLMAPWQDFPAGTTFAVKVLRADLVDEPDALATLRAEVEFSRAVHHPALARTRYAEFDGTVPEADPVTSAVADPEALQDAGARRPWLMLDFVPGDSLDEVVEREGTLPEPRVRQLVARVAKALAAVHAAGWVHGDVKPANIRVDKAGAAVLVDLGFGSRTGAPEAPLGTPAYLAPERSVGGPPAATADLFALGCTLYELLVGSPPTGAITGGIAAPSNAVPRVSPLLDALTLALLQTAPGSRPTAHDVETILERGEESRWWRDRIAFDASARRDTVAWSGRHRVPLVGRSDELDALDHAWDEARTEGRTVFLTGEQGSGKSRLLAEFAHRVRHGEGDPPLYLYGRCDAVGDDRPGAPLIHLLRRWLHLPRGAAPGPRAAELIDELVPADVSRTLLRLLAPDESGRAPAEMAESVALGDWLVALGKRVPTIVFLDDANYAGVATIDALRRVASSLHETRMLLVVGLRRRSETRHPAALNLLRTRLASRATTIKLGPLSKDAVEDLVQHAFHHTVPRRRLAKILVERTDGMPGSIGELLRLAAQRGWTRPAPPPNRGLELLISPDELPTPASIGVAVAERLSELRGRERIWLERVAVLGSRIEPELLARAWPNADVAARDAAIAALVRTNWLVSAGRRYRFAHPIEREETLQRTPPRRLVRSHDAIARALRDVEDERGLRPSFRRAYHLREAGRAHDLLAILPDLLDSVRDSGHPTRRATLARWGLEAIDEVRADASESTHDMERMLLEDLVDAADRLGDREEQRAALDRLTDLDLDPNTEPADAARVYLLHARHAVSSGQFGLARGLLRNAQQLAARAAEAGESLERLDLDRPEVERWLARIDIETGDYAAARAHATHAEALAVDEASRGHAQLLLAEVEIHEGRLDEALRRLATVRRDLRLADRSLRTRAARAATSLVSGRAWRLVGRPYHAMRAFERATELAVQAGEGRIEVEVTARRGRLFADVKRIAEAEASLREALFSARRIEDRRGETLAALFLGILLGEEGEAGAANLVGRAYSLAKELGMRRFEALALAIEARIAREAGDEEVALARSDAAMGLLDRHGAELPDRIVIAGTRALVLEEYDRGAEAQRIRQQLRRRIDRDNAQLRSSILRRRHRRWTVGLLASATSPDGPLYPRVVLVE